ncbi:MAG: ribonuclease HI family protein [Thermoplasmata archaeon]|nr:ribonuclease HI family protein [Thermoplasmata archaeon]
MTEPPLEPRIPRGTVVHEPIVRVAFDGACQPPKGGGVATYGFVVEGEGLEHRDKGLAVPPWSPHATNNVAEYVAATRALEWLLERGYRGIVLVAGDSQLVIRQMQGEYEVRAEHLREYHAQLARLVAQFEDVRFSWIPREQNVEADRLSKEALLEALPLARKLRPSSDGP